MLDRFDLSDPRQVITLAVCLTLALMAAAVVLVALGAWVSDKRWRWRLEPLADEWLRRRVEELALLFAWPRWTFTSMVPVSGDEQQRVFTWVPPLNAGIPWEVCAQVWSTEDGDLTLDERQRLRAGNLLVMANGQGGLEVWRQVRIPGAVRLNEMAPVIEDVGQDAHEWRRWLLDQRRRCPR
jgi:hypothetical protein